MRLFNHDIRGSGPASLGLGRMYASRALCITAKDDVIQLPAELKKHWDFILAHYARVGLECCHQVVWSLNLDHIKDYPDRELSPFFFGKRENLFRPDEKRFQVTQFLNSKNNFIEFAFANGIRVPDTQVFKSVFDIRYKNINIDFPLYLKPEISLSGLGIVRCESGAALTRLLDHVVNEFPCQLQQALTVKCWLNFQFEEVDGKAQLFLVSEQIIKDNAHLGNIYPSKYADVKIFNEFAQLIVDLGMHGIFAFDVGVVESELGDQFFVIECNPRINAATYPATVAKKLQVGQWKSVTLKTSFRSYADFNMKDIEFNPVTAWGVVVINWGSIEHGNIMFMLIGTLEQQDFLFNEMSSRLNVGLESEKEPILLSPTQIAQITGGEWKNCDADSLTLTGINHYLPYVVAGDLFFDLRKPEEIEQDGSGLRFARVFKKGVSAAVIGKENSNVINAPVLLVSNPAKALQELATATSLQFDGVKVQVIGSHGKTGFKTQLHHLLQGQLRVHAHLDSANLQNPVWRALAAIPRDAQVAIIEAAIPTAFAGTDRSFYIRPNHIVLTGIGFEHLSSHKTLDNLIINKVSSLKGLRPGGSVLLNADDPFYSQVLSEVRKVSKCKVYTFGSDEKDDGFLIHAFFDDFQWFIKARILDEVIEYRVPLPENYAPLASVSVLLMAKLLGCDLRQCATQYQSYQHFESSGNLFEVSLATGRFQIYDQSRRGEWKGFLSMFELMSRFKPERQGRKIAVISELINRQDNPNAPIDLLEMKAVMTRAGMDALFTVANFKDHVLALPDGVNWIAHEAESAAIHARVLDYVSENDVVFVRGVEKSRLDKLVQALLAKGTSVKKLF